MQQLKPGMESVFLFYKATYKNDQHCSQSLSHSRQWSDRERLETRTNNGLISLWQSKTSFKAPTESVVCSWKRLIPSVGHLALSTPQQTRKYTHMRSLKSFKNFCSSSDWVKLDFLLLAFSCKRRHDDTTSSLCSVRCSWPSGNFKARSSASFAIDCTFSPRAFRSNCKGIHNLSPEWWYRVWWCHECHAIFYMLRHVI